MALIDLFSETYTLDQKSNGTQRLINWYYEKYKDGATKYAGAVVPRAGFSLATRISALPANKCRGLYYSSSGPDGRSRLYGVWGSKVYRFDLNVQIAYEIGTIGNDGNPVSMVDNGFYFVVVDGQAMFKASLFDADANPVFQQVTLPIVPKTTIEAQPTHVAFINQRLVINAKNTNYFFYSDFTDPTTLTGGETFQDGNFYSAEQSQDNISALSVLNGSLWIWGLRSYEIWRGTSNQDSPFAFVGGSSNAVGIEAVYSVAVASELVFWLAGSDKGAGSVYMGQGTTITNITDGIFDAVASITERSSAIGQAWTYKGVTYYAITFENANRTFCFDSSTNKWHELLLRDVDAGEWNFFPYQYATVVNGTTYCGMVAHDACLVKMDYTKFTEWDGRLILREGISVPFFDNMDAFNIRQVLIDMQVGETELLTGYGSNPKIGLMISRDGGRTFGNRVDKSIGKQGVYRQLVRWNNCGTCRNLCLKIVFSEPTPCTIYQARLEYEKWGNS